MLSTKKSDKVREAARTDGRTDQASPDMRKGLLTLLLLAAEDGGGRVQQGAPQRTTASVVVAAAGLRQEKRRCLERGTLRS